jgi:C-22 sterol desaturase
VSLPLASCFPTGTHSTGRGLIRLDRKTTTATILTVLIALLILEQAVYRAKKAHLPGKKWTIPVIGAFADSLNPTLENYKAQWNSGPLSAVSVFNM